MKLVSITILCQLIYCISQINCCPTKLGCELLAQGKISLNDISNLDSHSLDSNSTGT